MKPYRPDTLPVEDLDYRQLLPLVGRANAALARYDGLLQGIPNPAVMLSPLTTREAVLSSKIEGTQATVDEVLEHEAGLEKEGEKYKDIQEISNYRLALHQAVNYLANYPIRLSFIRELHKTLMNSVRGQSKSPGEFRKAQNWIGFAGCSIEQAAFVPPSPLYMQDGLGALEDYMDSDDIDFLLQTAVVHAQFELIHPFEDGNGRIGRILIPLFLFQKKVLSQPMFYLSEYLEENRDEYYQRLRNISANGDWNGWIAYFLRAAHHQAANNARKVKQIMDLYEEMKQKIHQVTHSQYVNHVLDAMFSTPIFRTTDLVKTTGIHKPTAMNLIQKLKQQDILQELVPGSGRRAAILCFERLLFITR